MKLDRLKAIDLYLGTALLLIVRPISLVLGFLLRRDHEVRVDRQIVIFKILGGGSLVIAYPALAALRRKHPDKKMTLICSSSVKAYAELLGIFDNFAIIDTSTPWGLVRTSLVALLQTWRADCLLNFELHSRLSGVFSLLTCARNRVAFFMTWNKWQYGITTHSIFYNGNSPIFSGYIQMAHALGADPGQLPDIAQTYRAAKCFKLREGFALPDNYKLVLAPFCSELCEERMFTAEEWGAILGSSINRESLTIFLLGGPADKEKSEHYRKVLERRFPAWKIIDLAGALTLAESIAVMIESDEIFTVDSGLNNFAHLLGLKTTSFWGPSDPSMRLPPYDPATSKETVIYNRLSCSPCVHTIDHAPCNGNNVCMKQHLPGVTAVLPRVGWLKAPRRKAIQP